MTAEVTHAALAGIRDLVLLADSSHPAGNALYRRLGHRVLTGWPAYGSPGPGLSRDGAGDARHEEGEPVQALVVRTARRIGDSLDGSSSETRKRSTAVGSPMTARPSSSLIS
ncbi:hypothetical protein [Streptomyces chilikensis]|uniref:N-acetyltransferase domain-containing protein n=1 Tax=Streptomyces chilikensis TaxID=1194079 RepID=A0ABV3EJQ2_9ACTN